tara:strand:+ start:1050 stop:1358 length:309 start_codon:yes stop_codon:yes gene_type:complete
MDMTKQNIIIRLIDQGHIVIACADRLLNAKDSYVEDIRDLHRDGPINTTEAVVLLAKAEGRLGRDLGPLRTQVRVPNNMTSDWDHSPADDEFIPMKNNLEDL